VRVHKLNGQLTCKSEQKWKKSAETASTYVQQLMTSDGDEKKQTEKENELKRIAICRAQHAQRQYLRWAL
jgi:hypothetical protein